MKKITWNSPVILSFVLLSGAALLLNWASGGWANRYLFSVYSGSLLDPLFYVRLFGHVLGHASLSHYSGNMVLILLIGPLLEEKYGSRRLLSIIAVVALTTGIMHILLDGNTALLGASGVAFAFMLLASVTGRGSGIPLTLVIAVVIYLGQEIMTGIASADSISQLTHIIGGAVGGIYGMILRPKRR